MAKRFKFRYVNEIVGSFVLFVALVLVAGILVAGRSQHWFEKRKIITLNFPAEGVMELQVGADVMLLGAKIGSVRSIDVTPDGGMEGTIAVRYAFLRHIRQDSVALVKRKMVVAGDAYVEITPGTGAILPRMDASLECRKDTEIMELAMQVLDEVKAQAVHTLELVNAAIVEYTALAAGLNDPEGGVQQLLANVNGLLDDVRHGEGTPSRILNDPAMADSIASIVNQAADTVGQVNAILAETRDMLSTLSPAVGTAASQADRIPALLGETETLMRESTATLEGLQKHWLLRRYMAPDSAPATNEPLP
jgi:phospholipid/cholesterol/gamma-HCH transport system substrate-binding protein